MHELIRQNRLNGGSDAEVASEGLQGSWSSRDPDRKRDQTSYLEALRKSGHYWLDSWRGVFAGKRLHSDLLAGMTVAAVALPLNVALAVACGLPASAGLIAGAIGGGLAAIFGGTVMQVTGPAAALNVLVLAIVMKWGVVGAFAAAIVTGVMQILIFFTRAGTLARFIPEAVLVGFTTGVGLKLLDQQIPLLLDVELEVHQLFLSIGNPVWLNDVQWLAVISGLFVIVFMLGLSRFPKFPAAIAGLALATGVSSYLGWEIHRVGSVPSTFPSPSLPSLAWSEWIDIAIAAIPLAILATAESLLSSKALDRALPKEKKHESNLEAFGQGIANIGAGLFGGMPVSGVIVRSSVNVQSGGRTRISSLFHAVLLLAAPILAAAWISRIPIAALAGLLCLVGYRLVEIKTWWHEMRESKIQGVAFILASIAVVSGHLTLGLIAALLVSWFGLYLRKKSEERKAKYSRKERENLPEGIRARLPSKRPDQFFKPKPSVFHPPEEDWDAHVHQAPVIHPTAFVHANASIIGRVVLSPGVHVAAEAALRADEGTPFFIGNNTNIQDGVVLHALKRKWVQVGSDRWAIYIGERCSLAHQALVHGPCYIGDDTFIGFKAVVHDAIVGNGCSIGIGAIVVGVEVPDGRFVPPGSIIDTPEKAQALGPALEAHRHFNEDVVEVNIGLGEAYRGDWLLPKLPKTSFAKF